MKSILLFDTAEGSDNVGDNIIMDYCQQQLLDLFNDQLYWYDRVPTHLEVGKSAYRMNKKAHYSFVCGTNILKSTMLKKKIWKIGLREAFNLKGLVLMGTGWGNYNSFSPDPYTKFVYRSVLHTKLYHSVRDEYTKSKLNSIGIRNVLNTACPTMWKLTPEHCCQIPTTKSREVMMALTYYKPDVERDTYMFEVLQKNYDKVYLWIQQQEDYAYFKSLNVKGDVEIVTPLLASFDRLLQTHELDFVGSRLHGGIRALNFKRRTLIIGIDNRAIEINRDTNLPVINRENIESLDHWINACMPTEIVLPVDNILNWKSQFR